MKTIIKQSPLVLFFLIVGCSQKYEVNVEEEQENVRQVFMNFVKEVEAGNTDGYFSYITKDFIGYDAGAEPFTNMDTLRSFLNTFFEGNTFRLTDHESQEVIVRNDIAIHRHKGTMIIKPKNDTTEIRIKMKYLDVLKKNENGDWRIYIHSTSPNQ